MVTTSSQLRSCLSGGAPRARAAVVLVAAVALLAACSDSPTENKPPGSDSTVAEPSVEARALWLSRYDYSTQAQLVALIDSAAVANFNIIYFQARGNADALYAPGLEPWFRSLSGGTLGRDPGWDPLQVAIQRAHLRNIELHAWLNVTTAWATTYALTESTPRHQLLVHPEWALRDTIASSGKLLVDERMGRQVGNTVEGLSDYFDRLNRMQVQLHLRSEALLNQSVSEGRPGAKVYFGARLVPRPDKFYELELVSDPRGVDKVTNYTTTTSINGGTPTTTTTTETKNTQSLAFTLQMGKRFGPVTLRGGLIENSGGVGVDVHLLDERLRVSLSMFQFNRPQNKVFPRAKIWADYVFYRNFYVTTGVDDFFNRYRSATRPGGRPFSLGTDVFFGAGLHFTDDDIKTLLSSGAGSAVGSSGR